MLVLCSAERAARAQDDWLPQLDPPPGDYRGRSDPIVIVLPDDLDPTVYDNLAVELDDLDVSAFVTVESGRLVLTPPEALNSGSHGLRLIERGREGSILERGFWALEVRHSALVRDLSLTADLEAKLTGRIAENGLDTPPQHVTGESGGNVAAAAGDENWRVSGNANYIYNSQAELGVDGRNLDIGEYRIDGDFQNDDLFAGVTIGDHDIGLQNFIMSDFYRRGLSLRAGLPDDRLTVTGFIQSTEALAGTRHVLGISHEEDRVEGVSVSVRPIPGLEENIQLSGTFYTGEGSDGGFGIGTEEIVNDGTGWSVVADTLWFDEALRLRGEYAQAEFDFDGKDQGFSAETSDAYSVLASLEPLRGETLDGSYFNWTVSARREVVDTFFQSLANPSLVPDRESTVVETNFFWEEFTAFASFEHLLSNVDDFDYLPTDRFLNIKFKGTYTPFVEPEEDGSLPWYGQPFFGIDAEFNETDRMERSVDNPDEDANNSTRVVTLSLGSNYETWYWNLSHTFYSFEDHVDLFNDTFDNFTSVSASFQVDDWLRLSPELQFNLFNDLDSDADTQVIWGSLGAEITIIPETVTTRLTYKVEYQFGDNDTPDSHSLSGEVEWILLQPEINRPGVSVALTGFVQDTKDDLDNTEPDFQYQAFTQLRLSLPVSY